MNASYSIVNGELVPAGLASLRVADLAIQRGYGVFDYLKTVNGTPVFLDDHLDRLDASTRELRLPIPGGRDAVREAITRLADANAIADSGIRITVTGGYSPDGYNVATPNVILTQSPLRIAPNPAGCRLMTHAFRRQLPTVKTLDYLMAVLLQPTIRDRGCDDVVYHLDGVLSECPRMNLFVVLADGTLATPGRFVLRGVVRKHVIALARGDGQAVSEQDVTLEMLRSAREAFVTSTTKNLVPVIALDGQPVGNGEPGPIARRLGSLLLDRIAVDADVRLATPASSRAPLRHGFNP